MRSDDEKGLGWRPDLPDVRDYEYGNRFTVERPAALPLSVSLRGMQSPVRDQGNEGSCVGHAIAAGVDCLRRSDKRREARWRADDTIYSPRWVYHRARFLEGPQWVQIDAGAYIRFGIKGVAKEGIPPESNWRYEPGKFTDAPTFFAESQKARWKLGLYTRCATLAETLNSLDAGRPVVFGFTCYSSMFSPHVARTGVIPLPSGSVEGGHAVLAVGYDRARKLIEFKNSWGADWGDDGYGWLPFAYFDNRNLSDDHWSLGGEA